MMTSKLIMAAWLLSIALLGTALFFGYDEAVYYMGQDNIFVGEHWRFGWFK